MPADFVIATGDMILIKIPPPAIVPQLLAPIPLLGSSTSVKAMNKPICLFGDELPAMIAGPLPYTAPPFAVPGVGTLKIMLTPANFTMMTKNGKPILIKGSTFPVIFTVSSPALMPPPVGTPDALVVKPGTGQFITTNVVVKAG
ncbi:MAG: hypothetical protein ACR2MO_02505 [Acidimicrobiales bacterium]